MKSFNALYKQGISCSLIVTLDNSKFSTLGKFFSLFTTTSESCPILISIGFGSTTFTITVYVFFEPFSAVTTISNLFSPSFTSCVPSPETLAFESSSVAFILMLVVLASACTV